MTLLNASQLANLRKRPQSTKLYLSIYQPKVIFQTRVTGTYDQGDARINYYATTTGSYQNIYPNMVSRVGSSKGGNEYGELRVRNASGTYITFAENEMVWTQNMWITLIDYIDITAIYPRIIQDPSNQTNVIFYKDYDIPYSNQNTIYGTFPCAGPHRAGFIVTGAYSTYWSSSGTYNVKGDSLTYSWAFEGGTPTGSTAKDPGYVQYTTPGHYKTRLITTSSSGAVDTTYRYVSAYQKPNQGTFNPIEAWEITELNGSRGEGGYTARIKIMSILPEIQPKALIVIWAEDTYGGNIVSIGGNSQYNESVVFVGYVLNDSIKFNYQQSTMEFDVGSVTELMKDSEGFSVSCESKAAATTWYELTEMTVQKALYHYLRWHSTVLNVTDFQYTNDDRYVQYLDTDRESLFDAVDNFLRRGLLGSLVSDCQGKLWAQISHFGLTTPFATVPRGMSLNKQDWMGDPTIHERRGYDTSFVELGGIAYYGVTTNTFSALISNAPGTAPLYRGKTEREEGLILISQAQLNQVAANYLAYKNTQFNEVQLSINGNYRNLDIAPQEQQFLVIAPSDTIRNVNLQGKPYQITSMSWSYNSVNESFYPEVILEQMATGTMSQTVLIPVTPPYVDSGFDYPGLQLPTYPVFNPPTSTGPLSPIQLLIHDRLDGTNGYGFLYSDNFDSGSPNWLTVNAGLTSTQYINANFMFTTPNGAFYVGRIAVGATGDGAFVARANKIGEPFTILFDSSNLNIGGGGPYGVMCCSFNPEQSESVAVVLRFSNSNNHVFYYGANTSWTAGATVSTSNFLGSLSYGANSWLYTSYNAFVKLSATGAIQATGSPSISLHHFRGSSASGRTISQDNNLVSWDIGENNMATIKNLADANLRLEGMQTAVSPNGLQLMARYNNGGARGRSSDGGTTWSPIPNLFFTTNWVWAYAGQEGSSLTGSKWIAAGGSTVQFSKDYGNSWQEKTGDLLQLVAFTFRPDMIFVPGVTQRNAFALYN